MAEREFSLSGDSCISCSEPCNELYILLVEGKKIKELGGITSTKRCIAPGAAQRGQRHGLQEGHMERPTANRVCTIYTTVDNAQSQR